MDSVRRALALGVLLVACTGVGLAGQDAATSATARLAPAEMEAFLLKAPKVGGLRSTGKGVTDSKKGTLSDGRVTHAVHVQDIDDKRAIFEAGAKTELNFKDWYGYNIAGYKLAQLIGLDKVPVPMSVERRLEDKPAAVTWWVDDVLMDEQDRTKKGVQGPSPQRTVNQLAVMTVFDELIQNKDRNQGNILWTSDWTMWLIDHTRAFRTGKELLKPAQLARCERGLLERLRGLTADSLDQAVGRWLTKAEKDAVMARRDLIVKHFEARIAKLGEAAVLYTL